VPRCPRLPATAPSGHRGQLERPCLSTGPGLDRVDQLLQPRSQFRGCGGVLVQQGQSFFEQGLSTNERLLRRFLASAWMRIRSRHTDPPSMGRSGLCGTIRSLSTPPVRASPRSRCREPRSRFQSIRRRRSVDPSDGLPERRAACPARS